MDAELIPGAEFKALARRIREVSPEVRKEMNRAARTATAPAEKQLKAAVLGIASKGVAGGGGRSRLEHARSRSKTGKVPASGGGGLRRNTAKGITRKITYSGYRIGVRIRSDTKYLPADQKTLPKAMNKGKVRHPAGWGNNRGSVWVNQTFTPAGWFDKTMKSFGPKVTRDLDVAARKALNTLT